MQQIPPPPPPPAPAPVPSPGHEFSRGLARSIWAIGAVLIVAAGVGGFLALRQSLADDASTSPPSSTAPGATPELAAQYSALADEANARSAPLEVEANRLLRPGIVTAANLPAIQDVLRRMNEETRDFDAKLAQIPFPPTMATDVQAILAADTQITAASDKIVAGGCTSACTAWAESAPYFDLRARATRKLRADLGLPPPE
jgi:hypothetical protein